MESMSCGTPVVGFDIGGNSDMIEHKSNGYLARPYDEGDLKNGIEWVLNHNSYDILRKECRKKVVSCFGSVLVVKRYIDLYKNILKKKLT